MRQKKALSAVISLSMLLLITIIANIAFNNWYNNYSNDLTHKSKSDYFGSESIELVQIKNNVLYLKSELNTPIDEIQLINSSWSCVVNSLQIEDYEITDNSQNNLRQINLTSVCSELESNQIYLGLLIQDSKVLKQHVKSE